MGAINNSGGAKFANIKKGKIVIYNGKDIPDTVVDGWEGHVTAIQFATDSYQGKPFDVINVTIDDGQQPIKLKFRVDSGYYRQFAAKIVNVDISQPVAFQPSYKDEKSGMFINQFGVPIKQKWTRDNPGNMPPPREFEGRDGKEYDYRKQREFLKEELSKITFGHAAISGPQSQLPEPVNASLMNEPMDDLPF